MGQKLHITALFCLFFFPELTERSESEMYFSTITWELGSVSLVNTESGINYHVGTTESWDSVLDPVA